MSQDLHTIRRNNLLLLLREFSQARIAAGEATNGTEKAFAEQLQVSKSLLSQLKTSRPISDANAMQIEARCGKRPGWMSEAQPLAAGPAPGEEALVALLRQAYRSGSREQRARMREQISQWVRASR